MKNILYFDIETQKLADEVGGWSNINLLKLAVAVAYSTQNGEYFVYLEKDVQGLVNLLVAADLIVGFNVKRFDYIVIKPYTDISLCELPTLDMLEDIYQTLGFRVSLDKLASATLGEKKLADGIQAVQWYKKGKIDKIIEYCKKDVEITRKLHEYGCKQGFVCFTGRGGIKQPIPVNWKL